MFVDFMHDKYSFLPKCAGIGRFNQRFPGIEIRTSVGDLFTTLPFRIPALNSGYNIIKRRGLSLTPTAIAFIEILIEIDKKQSVSEVDLVESLGPVIEN